MRINSFEIVNNCISNDYSYIDLTIAKSLSSQLWIKITNLDYFEKYKLISTEVVVPRRINLI